MGMRMIERVLPAGVQCGEKIFSKLYVFEGLERRR
jgi:ribosomal protein L13